MTSPQTVLGVYSTAETRATVTARYQALCRLIADWMRSTLTAPESVVAPRGWFDGHAVDFKPVAYNGLVCGYLPLVYTDDDDVIGPILKGSA